MKLLKILAGIGGAAIAAIGVTGGTANAAASPWTPVYLHEISGNGCASYAAPQRLEPITSERCTASNWWYYRDLDHSSFPPQPGDRLEFVDFTKTYALGFSGGEIKLETPNANSTYAFQDLGVLTLPNGDFIYPNGAGLPLRVSMSGPTLGNTNDEWAECPLSDSTCGP